MIPAVALTAAACSDDEGGPRPQEPGFEFSVVEKTMTGAKITVKELSNTITYYVAVDNKPEIDAKCPTDTEYFSMKMDFIKVMAGVNGMTVEDYLKRELKRGTSMLDETDLFYDTDYYVCAFGLTPDGEVTTPLARKVFRTESFAPSETCRFIIQEVISTSTTIKVEVGVSDPSVRYYVTAMTQEELEGFDSVNEAVSDILFSESLFDDEFWADPNNTYTGRQTLLLAELEPGTTYKVLAFGVNAAGEQTTEAAVETFSTLPE